MYPDSVQKSLGFSLLLAVCLFVLGFQGAQAWDGDEEAKAEQEQEWLVNAPPGVGREVPIDTTEGTWMSLDVHPSGTELVFDLLGDIYTLPIEGGTAKRIAAGMAWQMQPQYSPDGEQIAFTSDEGGGDNIWIAKSDGSEARQVTKEDFRLLNSPAWTPDGEYVAARKHFTSRRSLGAGEIWLYHVSGGKGLQMTTRRNQQKDLGEPAFSPDGRYLYYSYDATPGSVFEYSKDSTAGIYNIDRLDRETGEILTILSGPGGACRPVPSPDGKQLAFVRRLDYLTTLFVLDLASGEAQPLFNGLERDMQETWAIHGVYPTLDWTPDGESIVFYAKGKLQRIELETKAVQDIPFRVSDSREVREAVRFPVVVAPERFDVRCLRQVVVSPSGDQVIYQALGRLWTRALPDGRPARLTGSEQFEFYPSFSRDGSQLCYVGWDDEKLGTIWVLDLATGEERRVTNEPGHYVTPVFTPDGKEIVFRRVGGGYITSPLWSYETGIFRVSANGGEPQLITQRGRSPQFGASSERVFLSDVKQEEDKDRRTLFSIDLDGSDERTHFVSENAVEWAVAPDEKWVAFSEGFRAYLAPFVPTGREVSMGPDTSSIPVRLVSTDAGENLQFSGDSKRLHWSLGPVLYGCAPQAAMALAMEEDGEDALPEIEERNIAFKAESDRNGGSYAVVGARLVTMRGDEVIESGTLLIEGDRLTAVGAEADVAVPAGMTVVDGRGTTIMPGIIDVHAHGPHAANGITPRNNWADHANLAFGVTTTHDPSHDTNSIFAAAELAQAGLILAPRTYSTGTILYGAAGSFKAEVDSLEDARAHIRRLKQVGAISVKSYNQPRREQRQQVLEAARELGLMVVPEGGSLFQHNMTMVVDGHTGVEHSLPVERVYSDVTQLWGATEVGYTPTLVVGYGGIWGENYWYEHMDVWRHERLTRFVPRFVVEARSRRRTKAPLEDYNTLRSASITKALVDVGSHVQIGAHGQLAGLGAHWELWMFVQGGMTNHEALRSATLSGAVYVGLDGDLGSLEVGKLADFLVLEQNPLEDIQNSESIRHTVLGGRMYDAKTMQRFDPASGERGPLPKYFWQDLEVGLGAQSTDSGCGCHAGL